jgi:hypothetical protein
MPVDSNLPISSGSPHSRCASCTLTQLELSAILFNPNLTVMSPFPLFITNGLAKVTLSFPSSLVMDLAAVLLLGPFALKSQPDAKGLLGLTL